MFRQDSDPEPTIFSELDPIRIRNPGIGTYNMLDWESYEYTLQTTKRNYKRHVTGT